ncbi:MAG TPA: Ig-like domain-containing protein [Vicinamibacterales bacterium]|nr:Ig-like domain-containing protein [Vicinamibacterales bacterium]
MKNTQGLRALPLVAAIVSVSFAVGCGQSTTSAATVTSVAVTGTIPSEGTTSQFKATATLTDGTTQDVTVQSTWQSSNNAIAMVSATGAVTALNLGTVNVQATYQNVAGVDSITIAP